MQSNASFQSAQQQIPKSNANIPQGPSGVVGTGLAHQSIPQMVQGGGAGTGVVLQQTPTGLMPQQRMMMPGGQLQPQQPGGIMQQQMHMGPFDQQQQQQRPVHMGGGVVVQQQHPNMIRPNLPPGAVMGGMPQQQQQQPQPPHQQQMVSMPQTPNMGYPNSQSYFKYHGFMTNSSGQQHFPGER